MPLVECDVKPLRTASSRRQLAGETPALPGPIYAATNSLALPTAPVASGA